MNLAVRIVEYVSITHVTALLVGQETAVGKVCVFYACVCMYVCYVSMNVFMYIWAYVHVYVCMYVCIYISAM